MPARPPPKLTNCTSVGPPRIGVLMRRLLEPAPVCPMTAARGMVRDPLAPAAMVKLPLKRMASDTDTAAVSVAVDPPGAASRLGRKPLPQVEVYGPTADVPQIAVVVFQLPET